MEQRKASVHPGQRLPRPIRDGRSNANQSPVRIGTLSHSLQVRINLTQKALILFGLLLLWAHTDLEENPWIIEIMRASDQ